MHGNGRRQRQNEPRQNSNPGDRFSQPRGLGRGFSDEQSGGYQQSVTIPDPGPATQTSVSAASNYGFYTNPEPSFPSAPAGDQMIYQTEYGQEPRQQQASYAGFGSNLNYGINQQPLGGILFENPQHFNQRQSAQGQDPSDSNVFYPSESMVAQVQPNIYPGPVNSILLSQSRPEAAAGTETSPTIGHAYRRCSADLGQIFQNISEGTVAVAGQLLSRFSEWFISHVEDMELTVDDASQQEIRSKLWDDFNNAWLALMHKQKTLTIALLDAGVTLQQPHLMTTEDINKLCSDLIKLDDEFLEKHGLVNYQYGVLEDEIIESAIACLDLLETHSSEQEGQQRRHFIGRQPPTSHPS